MTFLANFWGFGVDCGTWSEFYHCNPRCVLSNTIHFSSPVKIESKNFAFLAMVSIDHGDSCLTMETVDHGGSCLAMETVDYSLDFVFFGQFERNPPLALAQLSEVLWLVDCCSLAALKLDCQFQAYHTRISVLCCLQRLTILDLRVCSAREVLERQVAF